MSEIKNILRRHLVVIVLVFLVGIISVAPHLIFQFDDSYAGIQMFGADAEEHYVARIQEVNDGYPSLGNVFLSDKDQPYLSPGLGEVIVAYFGKLLFFDAIEVNIFSKLIFPIIIFLLIYALVYRLFLSKQVAILSALSVSFGYNLISRPDYILKLFSFITDQNGFLIYTRPINPEISSIFLFASLYVLFNIISKQGLIKKWEIVLVGAISGLLIYISIFPWSFLIVLFGLFFLYFLYKKEIIHLKNIIYVVIVNLALTIPFWINYFQIKSSEFYLDTAMRQGLVDSHTLVWSWWIFISFILVVFFWPDIYKRSKVFFLLSITSLFVVTNQHVITGILIQPSHYHWYITKPFVAIILSALFVYLVNRFIENKTVVKAIFALAIVALFYNAILIQSSSYIYRYPITVEKQRYAGVIHYLENEFQSIQNVWSSEVISELIPMYSRHNSPNNSYVGLYLNSEHFYIDRLLLNYKLHKTALDEIYTIMQDDRTRVSSRVYMIRFREEKGFSGAIPDEILRNFADRYADFYNRDLDTILNKFDIDIIVWDKKEEPDFMYMDLKTFKEIKNIDDEFIIYQSILLD